ncbi:MAG: hypothetical protein JKY55_20410 [Aliivibrio sp.]|uniref:hypothetical protein n=1 Tax=Aliivibrio sp. TaxID=1872443 RepID=UPI001A530336|nr:hypothetical protein [Aliivibrio sp.]
MDIDFFKVAKDVLLEVGVPASKATRFAENYFDATGINISQGPHYQIQQNKWGVECRIYYNSIDDLLDEFQELNIVPESGRRPYHEDRQYRINNIDFFWALVESGYRLGEN